MRLSLLQKLENAHDDSVWTAAWAPDGTLVTGSVDESAKVWRQGGGGGLEQAHVLVSAWAGRARVVCSSHRRRIGVLLLLGHTAWGVLRGARARRCGRRGARAATLVSNSSPPPART